MKKWDRIIALCLVLGLILAGCGENTGTGTDAVYVDSVGKLAGINGFAGVQNRFAGMVEPQATMKVNPEQGRTVKTTLVEEGQSVQEGDPLFVYDKSGEKREAFRDCAQPCASAEEAVRAGGTVLLSLPNSKVVEETIAALIRNAMIL